MITVVNIVVGICIDVLIHTFASSILVISVHFHVHITNNLRASSTSCSSSSTKILEFCSLLFVSPHMQCLCFGHSDPSQFVKGSHQRVVVAVVEPCRLVMVLIIFTIFLACIVILSSLHLYSTQLQLHSLQALLISFLPQHLAGLHICKHTVNI